MRHEWTRLTIDGFASGEVDFAARLAASNQTVRDDFDRLVMSPIVNGADGVVVTICGHSDRVDTGASHIACLQLEADASRQRANSADAVIFAKLSEWLDPAPTSWDDLPQVATYWFGNGANLLAVNPTNEDDRRRNRRVEFQVCRFYANDQ